MRRTICITFFIFIFINSVFSQNESIKTLVEKTNSLNLDISELTDFARKHLENKEQLARFFYYWTITNIKYDHKSLNEKTEGIISLNEYTNRQDEHQVYKNRKGVCAGYSNLFKWFMNEVDIESVRINGYIRDERNHYVELIKDDSFRHAWNAIKLNKKWIIIDSTWGTNEKKEISEFYFDLKPELSIITHYPEDKEWQLLKKPITLEEFNKSQFVKPIWFILGFTEAPKLMTDQEFYYFKFQDLPNNKWKVGLQVSTDNINFNGISSIQVIDKDGFSYFRFAKGQISKPAFFKVKLAKFENIGSGYTKIEHKDVINFKL